MSIETGYFDSQEKNKNKNTISPKIKEEINQEGFEENAALLIGKENEMLQLKEKLEAEGRTKNLETYIKLHKEICIPNSMISDEKFQKEVEAKKRYFKIFLQGGPPYSYTALLKFIDKKGDVAKVKIRFDRIEDLNSLSEESYDLAVKEVIKTKLKNLGFAKESENHETCKFWLDIEREERAYMEKLEKEAANKAEKEFDF